LVQKLLELGKNNKVLFIATFGYGDLIMALPAIVKYIQFNKLTEIGFVFYNPAYKYIINIIEPLKNIRIKYFYRKTSKKPISFHLYLVKDLFLKYDTVINLFPHQGIDSALFMLLIQAKKRIQQLYDYKVFKGVHWFLTDYKEVLDDHITVNNNYLLNSIKNAPSLNGLVNLEIYKVKKANIIGIHAGYNSVSEYKKWPIEYWIILLKKLKESILFQKYKFRMFWGPDEQDVFKTFDNECKNLDIDHIKLSLDQVIIKVSECNYFVGSDGLFGHLAALFDIKQLILFGDTMPKYCKPLSDKLYIISKNKNNENLPYNSKIKQFSFCIKDISAEQVEKSLIEILEI